jgi:hypothetical protein
MGRFRDRRIRNSPRFDWPTDQRRRVVVRIRARRVRPPLPRCAARRSVDRSRPGQRRSADPGARVPSKRGSPRRGRPARRTGRAAPTGPAGSTPPRSGWQTGGCHWPFAPAGNPKRRHRPPASPRSCAAAPVRPSRGCTVPSRPRRTARPRTGRCQSRSAARHRPGPGGSTASRRSARCRERAPRRAPGPVPLRTSTGARSTVTGPRAWWRTESPEGKP